MKQRGILCERLGGEVIQSKVRRERMGHIELAAPVAHIWFLKGVPSRIGTLLDMSLKQLEKILYFESYVCVDGGQTDMTEKELVTEDKLRTLQSEYAPNAYKVGIGADAIRELLRKIDINSKWDEIKAKAKVSTSAAMKKKFAKQLKVIEAFRKSGNKPEWMIMDVIPVLPPELRPLVPLDGGRFATSDLNDLYRRVINRNNRLKRLMELKAPGVIIRNEMRMLQEAVDALFDNGRRGRAIRGPNKRPLKSLSDMLKGKQGRFRQNLLGKRVDYSGRTVIVVGPELRLHQCGLPKKMALELFKPFIFHKLEERGAATTIKSAKRLVEKERPEVWDVLDEVIREHPVLLNRAPTLHRLGIQAFDPVLVEGKAIRLHPLVCAAFNADFDGDQMAVHIPLSVEAQLEARVLMLSVNNILSPANGRPITVPSQDIVLGCYYLTKARSGVLGEGKVFSGRDEVRIAYDQKMADIHARVRVRINGKIEETTVARALFSDVLPEGMSFSSINKEMNKKELAKLIDECFRKLGLRRTVILIDDLKEMGFKYAMRSGISICISDMHIPSKKQKFIDQAQKEVMEIHHQYTEGRITNGERYNKESDIWANVTEKIADEMMAELGMEAVELGGAKKSELAEARSFNNIFMMADSGARGSTQQIRQLAGMRGLMAKPSGEIIETPITANFREGLTVLQYFISTHGARKGLADTALKTANSGYLTRRLVDVAQDVIISEYDCGTVDGIYVGSIVESGEIIEPLRDRIVGRVSLEKIKDYEGNVIVDINNEITEELAGAIQSAGIERVKIRSVLTCESKRGVCVMCYGRNLATGRLVERGEAVGVIAAQSIGEPGTQLTMRTFHIGGTATRISEQSTQDAKNGGFARFIGVQVVRSKAGELVSMNRAGIMAVVDEKGREKERYQVVYGARVKVEEGTPVQLGQVMVEWDPYTFSILTEIGGTVAYKDLHEGMTLHEEVDEVTGLSRLVVVDSPDEKRQPPIVIRRAKTNKRYLMPSRAHLMVQDGDEVHPGDVLAKIPRESTKTKDITRGLPRVVELFEARKPRETAVISEIDGSVKFGEVAKGQRKIYVVSDDGTEREYSVPRGVHINVQEGERVRAGEPLMDGPLNPHDILAVLGEKELQGYLVNEIQEVYRLQGVTISDKHIEVIVRQMMRWVKVEDVGDTQFLLEEVVDRFRFREENEKAISDGGKPATGRPLLLGITKASLSTESFISAASFQETTRVLTEASIQGAVDHLRGFKENVIVGRLIPAGTGMEHYRNVRLSPELEEAANKVQEEVSQAYEEAERALELMRQEGENEPEELPAEQ